LPNVVLDAIRAGKVSIENAHEVLNASAMSSTYDPIIGSFDAAVVFADASGFTALTETLAARPHGAEEIGSYLNGFFGSLIEIVSSYGGDILKFSGDALTILWPVRTEDPDSDLYVEKSRAAATAACRCCLELQAKVKAFGKTPVQGSSLTLHIGVGFGFLRVLQLGGILNRWEYCATGKGLEEVAVAEPLATSGETVVSPTVVEVLRAGGRASKRFELREVVADGAPPGYMLLSGSDMEDESSDADSLDSIACNRDACPSLTSDLDPRLFERYIPAAILKRLAMDGGVPEAEMRQVAVIFLSVRGLNPGQRAEDAGRTQLLIRLFQRSCYALEGSVNKFLVDDKGMLLLVVFGLPPLNHYSDDPMRAALMATRCCDTLRDEELEGRAGVTTGTCWCGVIGNSVRREYTVLGDVVNLSARLMANAEPGAVLCDQVTHKASSEYLLFNENKEAIKVKGKAKPVPIFEFTGRLVPLKTREEALLRSELLAWKDWPSKALVDAALQEQVNAKGGVVFVEGGPGCGKTETVEHIKAWAAERGFSVLYGQNMNPTSTFAVSRLCWQEVFDSMLSALGSRRMPQVTPRDDDPLWSKDFAAGSSLNEAVRLKDSQILMSMLRAAGVDEDMMQWVPLLSYVIPSVNFGTKGVSALLERDEQRTVGTPRLATLCTKLFEAFTTHSKGTAGTVVLLHMKSGTSFKAETDVRDQNIARAVCNYCMLRRDTDASTPFIFCLVSRKDILEDGMIRDCADEAQGLVSLTGLDRKDVAGYLQHLVGGTSIADSIVDHVYEVSGGNPHGVRVLAQELQKNDVLTKIGDVIQPSPAFQDPGRLRSLPLPESLKGMAVGTFERLSYPQQVLVKTAAVCSKEKQDRAEHSDAFTVVELAPEPSSFSQVVKDCLALVRLGIFREVARGDSTDGISEPEEEKPMSNDDKDEKELDDGVATECANKGALRKRASSLPSHQISTMSTLRGPAVGKECSEMPQRMSIEIRHLQVTPTKKRTVAERAKRKHTLPPPNIASGGLRVPTDVHHSDIGDWSFCFVSKILQHVVLAMVLEVQQERIRKASAIRGRSQRFTVNAQSNRCEYQPQRGS